MRILILNQILFTAEKDTIPAVTSIKDTMIYNLCLGFKQLGHAITLAAAAEYRPQESEAYDFEILFFEQFVSFPDKFPFLLSNSGPCS